MVKNAFILVSCSQPHWTKGQQIPKPIHMVTVSLFSPTQKKTVFLCLLLKTKEYTWCYAITIIINPFFNEKKTQLEMNKSFFFHLQHTQCMKKMSSQQNSWKESKLSVSINTKVKFEIYIANEWHYCF